MPTIQKILVPVDFSACADVALSQASRLAQDLKATVLLLHVINPGSYVVESSGKSHVWDFTDYERAVRERLASMAADVSKAGVAVETDVMEGKPADVITKLASDKSMDLIVMGTHGRSGVGRALLGSVAERVLRTSAVPVMSIRGT